MIIHRDLKQFSNLSEKYYQSLSYPNVSMIVALKMSDFSANKLETLGRCLMASKTCRQVCLIKDSLLLFFISSPRVSPLFFEKSIHLCLDEFISVVTTHDAKCYKIIKAGKLGISILTVDTDTIKSAIIHATQATLSDDAHKVTFFDADMSYRIKRHHLLEQFIHDAIEKQAIQIAYQPIINSREWTIAGYEALSRFNLDNSLETTTQELIHIAEQIHKIADLNLIAYQHVLDEMTSHIIDTDQFLTINFSSGTQSDIASILDCLQVQLHQHDFPTNNLIIDINLAPGQSIDVYDPILPKFNKLGINFCLDDLSLGFALSRELEKKRYQYLKISRTSVRNFHKDSHFYEVIKLLVRICQNYKVKLIAEGVETFEEARLLSFIGVDFMQGYLFSRPCSVGGLHEQELYVQKQILRILSFSSIEEHDIEIMRIAKANVPRLDPGDPLSLAYEYFKDDAITVLPVIVDHQCVGLLDKNTLQLHMSPAMGTDRESSAEAKLWQKKVHLMMNTNFIKVDISTSLEEMLYLYDKHSLLLPLVVTQRARFKGIVTETLLLNYLISQQKEP